VKKGGKLKQLPLAFAVIDVKTTSGSLRRSRHPCHNARVFKWSCPTLNLPCGPPCEKSCPRSSSVDAHSTSGRQCGGTFKPSVYRCRMRLTTGSIESAERQWLCRSYLPMKFARPSRTSNRQHRTTNSSAGTWDTSRRRGWTLRCGHRQRGRFTSNQYARTTMWRGAWHYRLNAKARHGQLNMYQMVGLLHEEAVLVAVNVKLLSAGKAARL